MHPDRLAAIHQQKHSLHTLLHQHGIDIHDLGSLDIIDLIRNTNLPVGILASAISDLGIKIDGYSITRARTEVISMRKIMERIACLETMETNNVHSKTSHYSAICNAGIELRKPQKDRRLKKRYDSVGYTENIASVLSQSTDMPVPVNDIRHAIHCMRVDMLLSTNQMPDMQDLFDDVVMRYMDAYSEPKYFYNNPMVKILENGWDGTIPTFYKIVSKSQARTSAAWVPFEIELFHHFYNSHPPNLSLLDLEILSRYARAEPAEVLVDELKNFYDLISLEALRTHRRALIGQHELLPHIIHFGDVTGSNE